jgi:hypothetical protein
MRRPLLVAGLLALGLLLTGSPAGGFPTGFTLNFDSAHVGDGAGDTDLLVATLVGDVCDQDLRIALYRPDTSLVTDNGNGGDVGATQIQLTNPGSLVTEPGTYTVGVTCGGDAVGNPVPFEVLAAQEPPPPPPPPPPTDPPGPDVGPVAAEPVFTG